jgi:hypothetical protein
VTPDLRQTRRWIRRYRRPISAACAFASVLTFGLALTPAGEPPIESALRLPAGYVEMPVVLMSAAIAATLSPGDVVDVIAQEPRPSVIAEAAIVITPVTGGGGFGANGGAVVVLGLSRASGLAVAGTDAPLTVLRHTQ